MNVCCKVTRSVAAAPTISVIPSTILFNVVPLGLTLTASCTGHTDATPHPASHCGKRLRRSWLVLSRPVQALPLHTSHCRLERCCRLHNLVHNIRHPVECCPAGVHTRTLTHETHKTGHQHETQRHRAAPCRPLRPALCNTQHTACMVSHMLSGALHSSSRSSECSCRLHNLVHHIHHPVECCPAGVHTCSLTQPTPST